MDEHENRTTVQPDLPAQPPAESRRETLERLEKETTAQGADSSTGRRLNRRLLGTIAAWGGGAFLAGVVAGVLLSLGPVNASGAGETLAVALVVGAAAFLVVSLLAGMILLAREDGRVEREVEEQVGYDPMETDNPLQDRGSRRPHARRGR